ncbi:hypothetical protein PHISCL_05678 [Aspergillus sclerotialis]|uniref:Uncharacterized protein n=1 Tax=Aspergillus sclerotialis TaxID=2070753 RepID=A0A3A2ZRN0_9EURO|nr:hypothetical protein PHISCL_05678 [Aspergillus sclerotialis]
MEDIRPSAKWANRMLRPLTSIYRRLEKHNENLSMISSSKPKGKAETCDLDPTRVSTVEDGGSYSDGDGDDPAWVPDKRRVRHKYSTRVEGSRGRRRNRVTMRSPELNKTLLPGAIEIATPLITGKTTREALGRASAQKQSFRPPELRNSFPGVCKGRRTSRTNNPSFPAYQGSWKEVVDMSGDTEFINIAHLLDRVFLKFLSNTRGHILPWEQTEGARSLMSMVVRRLPEFIEEEQRIQDEEDGENEEDMCDAYLSELESYYAPGGGGWRPLREAVRAQGIYMVSEMIQRQWVTKLAACRLLEECMNHHELDAFELLSSKCLSTVEFYDYPTTFYPAKSSTHCDDPIQILSTYYSRTDRCSFVFNELEKLLRRRVMPPEWMVTKPWKKCVDAAITSFSTGDENSTAAKSLIEAVILCAGNSCLAINTTPVDGRSLGRARYLHLKATRTSTTNASASIEEQLPCPIPIQDALSNLTLSLMAALCGIHLARSHNPAAEERAISMKMKEFVKFLAFTVQREVEMRPPPKNADFPMPQFLRRGYVLLGHCLLQCGEGAPENIRWPEPMSWENVEAFFTLLSSRSDVIKELATLVRQVFHCYEHVHKSDQTRTSPEIRSKISSLIRLSDNRGLSILLGKVAAETAMDLAETTVDPDDHVWAVEVQEKAVSFQHEQGRRHGTADGQMGNNSGLYRWEDSIGEWVATTPPMLKAKAVEVSSKHFGAIRRPPSTIADSTTSDSPRLSPSGDSASSMTSSAPSVSLKRARSDSLSRSSKRQCSTPVSVYSGEETNSGDDAESLVSHETCELNSAPPAAYMRTRRGTQGEFTQTREIPRRAAREIMDPGSTGNIEVVITKKRDSTRHHDFAGQNSTVSLRRSTRSTTSRLPTTLRRNPPRKQTAPVVPRVVRTRSVIPCSQDDDSEDELNCF